MDRQCMWPALSPPSSSNTCRRRSWCTRHCQWLSCTSPLHRLHTSRRLVLSTPDCTRKRRRRSAPRARARSSLDSPRTRRCLLWTYTCWRRTRSTRLQHWCSRRGTHRTRRLSAPSASAWSLQDTMRRRQSRSLSCTGLRDMRCTCLRRDDPSFIVLTETKFSFRCIPVWDRYSPHRTRVEKKSTCDNALTMTSQVHW